jgi:hypothetical protein
MSLINKKLPNVYATIGRYLVLACLLLLAYFPVFFNGFVADDFDFIVNQPFSQLDQPVSTIFRGFVPPGHEGTYRPIKNLLVYYFSQIAGPTVFPYHLFSLIIHFAVVVLLYHLALKLGLGPWPAFFTAAVMAVHPLAVEAVAWITAAFDTIAFILVLTVFIFELSPRPLLPRPILLILTATAFGLYEYALLTPLLLYFLLRYKQPVIALNRTKPYLLLAVVFLAVRSFILDLPSRYSYPASATGSLLLISLKNLSFFLQKMFFPHPLSINHQLPDGLIAHTLPQFNLPLLAKLTFFDSYLVASITFLALLAIYTYQKNQNRLMFSLQWLFLALLPTFTVISQNPNLFAEKYAYLSLIGFSLFLGSLLDRYPQKFTFSLTGLYLIFLLLLTNQRTYAWNSTTSIIDAALVINPENPVLWYQRGEAYQKNGDLDRAQLSYLASVNQATDFSYPYINLGFIAETKGDASAAAALYRQALTKKPASPIPAYNLAVFAYQNSRLAEAESLLIQALAADSQYSPALVLYHRLHQN